MGAYPIDVKHSLQRCIDLAEHYKAIGMTSIFLSLGGKEDTLNMDLPWEYVSDVGEKPGWRNGIPASYHFKAEHPCGLEFEWYVEFSLDNSDYYPQLDVSKMRECLDLCPPHLAEKFRHAMLQELPDLDKEIERLRQEYIKRRDTIAAYRALAEEVTRL